MSDTIAGERPPGAAADAGSGGPPVRPATRTENLSTVAFATWLIVGIFVDGWAHDNNKPETFFTPWHAMFYSGFVATAAWMLHVVMRRRVAGEPVSVAVPPGYGLGLVGVAVFAAGGAFDLVWHQLFGIEVDLEALLSPSHLTLFVGALLVVSTPLRAAWRDPSSRAPGFGEFLPAALSVTLAAATTAFFFMYYAPTLTGAMTDTPYRFLAEVFDRPTVEWMTEEVQIEGYAAILVTTVILMAPALLMARRWVLPFGTMTVLFGAVFVLTGAIESFDMGWTCLAGLAGGLAGDVLYRRLRVTPERVGRLRVVAAVTPVALWLAYFAALGIFFTVGWSVELWAGAAVMSGITGLGLSLLAAPPALPPTVPPAVPSGSGGQSI